MSPRTISEHIAAHALAARSTALPEEVVAWLQTLTLDSIGCMYGALDSKLATTMRSALAELGRADGSTLVGTAQEGDLGTAILYNGALLRYLDMNDVQGSDAPRHGHNSEFLPTVLAMGERLHLSGRQMLRALSLGYDLGTAFTDAVVGRTFEARGWNMDLRAAIAVPAVAGTMLELPLSVVASAIGLSASRCGVLNVLDSSVEENSMAKNLRFPLTAQMAVQATLLARAGVTGPLEVFEAESGIANVLLQGEFSPEPLTDGFRRHRVMEACVKPFAACYATHGHLTATTALVRQHRFAPEDVVGVRIRTTTRGVAHTAHPDRRYPKNKETADHSAYYLTAVAIVDGAVGPAQFAEHRLHDPVVRRLSDQVEVEADPTLDASYPAAEVTVTLADGRVLQKLVLEPKGQPGNPMADWEVEEKFTDLCGPWAGPERARDIVQTVRRVDALEDVADLGRLLRSPDDAEGRRR